MGILSRRFLQTASDPAQTNAEKNQAKIAFFLFFPAKDLARFCHAVLDFRDFFKQAIYALTMSWLALSSLGGSWKGSRQSSAGSFGPNVCSERSLNALANLSFSRSLPTASSPHAVSFVNGCARTSAHHSAMRPRRASVSASAYLEKELPSTSTFPSNVELLVELGTRWRCDEWRNKQWGCDQWEG